MIRILDGHYMISNSPDWLDRLRALPVRSWAPYEDAWLVPYTVEGRQMLLDAGFKIDHLSKPQNVSYLVDTDGKAYLTIRTMGSKDDVQRCRNIPEYRRYDADKRLWVFRPTQKNIEYIKGAFPGIMWSPGAEAMVHTPNKVEKVVKKYPADFKFKMQPFPHQLEDFHKTRDLEWWAFFWDQGTGKSKIFIDTFAYNAQLGKVEALLMIMPNAVKATWQDDELPAHMPDWMNADVFVWDTPTKHKAKAWVLSASKGAKVMIMNVEALSHPSGVEVANLFVSRWKTMIGIDESSIIGNHKAKRTKAILKLGQKSPIRRIGDGTPATESPMEFFSQALFMSKNVFGTNFYAYRNRYAKLGGWQGKQIVGYQNLDELQMIIDQHSSRVLKEEVFKDLPSQSFTKRVIELTPEQRRMYDDLMSELKTETAKGTVEVEHTITKLLRVHQVVGGFMPATMFTVDPETGDIEPVKYDKPPAIPGGNPKLDELLSIGHQTHEKIIVYCRFRPEMDMITKVLRDKYGAAAVVEMRGGMTNDQRRSAKTRFQNSPEVRWMVAQSRAAGRGLTLTACHTVVYFSNDFSLRVRLQSQDRVHRFGQTKPVTYIDLIAKGTIDDHLVKTLRKKKSLADLIHGDPTLSWL